MKKFLALIIAFLIIVSSVNVILVYADSSNVIYVSGNTYPESDHEYQNDFYGKWEYTYSSEAEGLYLTFSDKTSFNYYSEEDEEGWTGYYYDYVIISSLDSDGNDIMESSYITQELSGKTIYVYGNKFRITLETDSKGTDYGFSIDRISHEPPENSIVIRYHFGDYEKVDYCDVFNNEEAFVRGGLVKNRGFAFSGWSLQPNGNTDYYKDDIIADSGIYDLYPVYTKLIIAPEDSFSFLNGEIGYTYPADGDYYMSAEHYMIMLKNLFKNFGLGPIPGPIAALVLSTYPTWNFTGSCYGMAASVFLQYHGVADFLSDNYADNLSEVRLNSKTISMVNYYQAQAASSYLCENIVPTPGTTFYSENLKNIYETVKNGSPVLLTYYKDDYLVTMGHAVTLTGAFEDSYGNKFVVGYDSNYNYTWGECHYFRITPDYSAFYSCYDSPKNTEEFQEWHNVPVTGFNWTADYEQFSSFDINGEGDPMVWYRVFFAHIIHYISTLFSSIF